MKPMYVPRKVRVTFAILGLPAKFWPTEEYDLRNVDHIKTWKINEKMHRAISIETISFKSYWSSYVAQYALQLNNKAMKSARDNPIKLNTKD